MTALKVIGALLIAAGLVVGTIFVVRRTGDDDDGDTDDGLGGAVKEALKNPDVQKALHDVGELLGKVTKVTGKLVQFGDDVLNFKSHGQKVSAAVGKTGSAARIVVSAPATVAKSVLNPVRSVFGLGGSGTNVSGLLGKVGSGGLAGLFGR